MKRKGIALFALLIFVMSSSFARLSILAPKAPPTIPLLKMAADDPELDVLLYNDAVSEVLPKILKGQKNLAVLPTNLAANLYNKGQKIKLLGVTSMGILYIVSTDSQVKSITDLNAKPVSIGEPGTSPDVIARTLFARENIKPVIQYSSSSEIARFFIAGKIRMAVLPEPLATLVLSANTNGQRICDLRAEWKELGLGRGIPQVGIIVPSEMLSESNEEIHSFTLKYFDAANWVLSHKKEAATLAEKKLGMGLSSEIYEKAIPNMNLIYLSGKDAAPDLKAYYQVLLDNDPASVGDRLPDDDFFGE